MKSIMVLLLYGVSLFPMEKDDQPFEKASAVPEGTKDTIEVWHKVELSPSITFANGRYECRGVYKSEGMFWLQFFDDEEHRIKNYGYSLREALQGWELDKSITDIHMYGVARISECLYVAVLLAKEKEADDVFIHTRCNIKKQDAYWYIKSTQGHYTDIELSVSIKNNFNFGMRVKKDNQMFNSCSVYSENGQFGRFDMMPLEEKRGL
jgi:hypothetical protein